MMNLKKAVVAPSVAVLSLMGFMAMEAPAMAQTAGGDPAMDAGQSAGMTRRPLTVRRVIRRPMRSGSEVTATNGLKGPHPGSVTARTAPQTTPDAGVGVAGTGPISGGVGTIVGLPFQAMGGIFPAGGPRKGGVTSVMYANAGKEQAKIDEGWAEPVPVDFSGPIYVVENGDPTVSPLSLIGAPISAIGQVAQSPFKIIGAAGL